MRKLSVIAIMFILSLSFTAEAQNRRRSAQEPSDREYWVDLLYKIAAPVLSNMSAGELQKNMEVELSPTWDNRDRKFIYMEAFCRVMGGVAPWLNLPDDNTPEGAKRKQMREWALGSLRHAVDPASPDYLPWSSQSQPLVEAAFLANAFIRAPQALWEPLDDLTKERYIKEFKGLRRVMPPYNNWLLFRGIVEAFLALIDEQPDGFAMNVAVRKINEWYLGDGWYADGPELSVDYYNSFVMQPMLVEMLDVMTQKRIYTPISLDLALRRMDRYNRLLERMISPEATFPTIGRSITYRMGAFQTLALAVWKYELPESLPAGQVRNALTAVMKRMFSMEGNFNAGGFLQLGFVGHQPDLADYYSNSGSMYLTSLVFLPLGLPSDHEFWTSAPLPWTSQKAWSGQPFPKDYHESIMR